jgi:DNA repair protein RadD
LTTTKFNQKLLGLTATPGRSGEENENKLLANFYNSSRITLQDDFGRDIDNPIKYLQDLKILAKLKKEELYSNIEVKISENKMEELRLFGDDKLVEIINDLASHPGRNELIISRIEASIINNESILVFGCNVSHCLVLESLLKQKGINAKSVLGETPKSERANIINDFKNRDLNVLINYGVLTTGFDAPTLNTVMITRPTSSIVLYSQMIGRALRGPKNGGNEENLLIDIKDNFESESVQSMFTFFNEIWRN